MYRPLFGFRAGLTCLEHKPRGEGDTWPEFGHPSHVLAALRRALPAACPPLGQAMREALASAPS